MVLKRSQDHILLLFTIYGEFLELNRIGKGKKGLMIYESSCNIACTRLLCVVVYEYREGWKQ